MEFSKAYDKLNQDKMMLKLKIYLDPHVWLALKNYMREEDEPWGDPLGE